MPRLPDGRALVSARKSLHINVLELIAAELGLKSFLKGRFNTAVHLKVDNTTALSYLSKMGGTGNELMIDITKRIWSFLLEKNMSLTVEYVPSKLNVVADWESRNWRDSSEWLLKHSVFKTITNLWGYPSVDLFASRLSHQLPGYMSWKPDPESLATDALAQDWSELFPYAFPPFCLIGKTLQKIRKDKVNLILITPVWVMQPWYPLLLEMSIRNPLLLPNLQDLLQNPRREYHPLITNSSLRLAAWMVSWDPKQCLSFQQQLPHLSKAPGHRELEEVTNRPGESLVAGVLTNRLIQFHVI